MNASGVRNAQLVHQLVHDIKDALGIAIGNLDFALELDGAGTHDPQLLQQALDGCLEAAELVGQLRSAVLGPTPAAAASDQR